MCCCSQDLCFCLQLHAAACLLTIGRTCRQLISTWVREVEVADAVYEASADAISKACSLEVSSFHGANVYSVSNAMALMLCQ